MRNVERIGGKKYCGEKKKKKKEDVWGDQE